MEDKPQKPAIPLARGEVADANDGTVIRKPAWWKFFGPAFIISIGYFDPGNWATDLQAGSQFGYQLLWVLSLSCLIGAITQNLCAKLGLATQKDLAQHCNERFGPITSKFLFITAMISMMATDLAEIIGVAVALHLLFGIDLVMGAFITVVDVFLILLLNRWSFRAIETVFLAVLTAVAGIYIAEVIMSHPAYNTIIIDSIAPAEVTFTNPTALFIAVGIIGATIMPHNLYLHSSLAIRRLKEGLADAKTLYKWSQIDTNVSLFAAWFVNAAILIVAAAVFHPIFLENGKVIQDFGVAYETLIPLLGQGAGLIFAIALLCAGVASSTSATLAGQVVFEGFFPVKKINLFQIRLGIRLLTMAPAVICIIVGLHPVTVLVWSQVILSLQLPFALIPLLLFTGDRKLMGDFTNRAWIHYPMWAASIFMILLNILMLLQLAGIVGGG